MTPPMQKLTSEEALNTNIYRSGLAPAALLYFSGTGDSSASVLSSTTIERLEDLPQPLSVSVLMNAGANYASEQPVAMDEDDTPTSSQKVDRERLPPSTTPPASGSGDSERKAPKWFKMPLKK